MSILPTFKSDSYSDGRTKQAFKDETDINRILQRAQKTGTISHLNKNQGVYGDFADFDFLENTLMLTRGREIFEELPSEIRKEFNQSPSDFFKYVNDPANKDDLLKKLPGLAKPGYQLKDVSGKTAPEKAELVPAKPPASTPVKKRSDTDGSSDAEKSES